MARFTSSTFGKISGKHGLAVAAVRKDGLCILKEYRVASNPNTAGQKNQRGKFGFVMREINCLRSVFTRNFGGQYGINKVVAMVMKTAVAGQFPDFLLNYSQLPVSAGSLCGADKLAMKRIDVQVLQVSWDSDLNGSAGDKVHLVFLNSQTKTVLECYDCASRFEGKAEIQVPSTWVQTDIHAWLYFSSSETAKLSDSQYISIQ